MKRLCAVLAGLGLVVGWTISAHATMITSTSDLALQGATIIDFEGIAPGDYTTLVFSGVTIGSGLSIYDSDFSNFGATGQSLNNDFGTPTSFFLTFDTTVSAFGIIAGAVEKEITYNAFDINDTLIETVPFNSFFTSTPCCGGIFRGIQASGISRVHITTTAPDWVVFDDLHFVPEVVPEPSTLLLLGSGLVGLLWWRLNTTAL